MNALPKTAPTEAPLLPGKLRNARALWVVLIIMALLAGCALLFARGSMRLSGDWQSQLSDTMAVQIILENAEQWNDRIPLARKALADGLPGTDIEVLSRETAQDLIRPWIGNVDLPDNLPVPGLINLTGKNLSVGRVQSILGDVGIAANIDDNSRYADQLKGTTKRLVGIGLATLILILIAGLSVNIFATRAGMIAQKDVIRVLVQVGASDKFIAKLFVGQAFRRGAIGAAIGLSLASLFWIVLSIAGKWGGLGWTGLMEALSDIGYLVGLGIIFALICAIAAGITATRQLAFERKRL